MNVLLIVPTVPGYTYGFPYDFPFGMAYVSAALKKAGHRVECINAFHLRGSLSEKLCEIRERRNVDIIGVGGPSPMYSTLRDAVRDARQVFPETPVLLTGHIVNCMPEKMLRALQADFGVLGESETTVVELVAVLEDGIDPLQTAGLAVRNRATDEVIVTKASCGMENLDELPFPDYEGLEFAEYLDMIPPNAGHTLGGDFIDNQRSLLLMASRSCTERWTFSYHMPGEKYRQRSVGNCFAEIDYAIERFGVNFVFAHDESLFTNGNADRLFAFCDNFKKRGLRWGCELMIGEVTRDVLARMKDAGCVSIGYGIEQVSDTILKNMRKSITRKQIENTLDLTYNAEIDIQGGILFGDPAETVETFYETVAWWMQNRKYNIQIGPVYVIPNSQLYMQAREWGLIEDEIKYISSENMQTYVLNMTKMNHDEFVAMLGRIKELEHTSGLYMGMVEDVSNAGCDSYDRARFNIKVWCPHCGKHNDRREVFFPDAKKLQLWDSRYFLHCRSCHRSFSVPNPVSWCEEPNLPRRLFLTQHPPWRLFNLYRNRGGSLAELARNGNGNKSVEQSNSEITMERQKEKWREVPSVRAGRVFSRDLMELSDTDLLAYWEDCRSSTSTIVHRQWFQEKYQPILAGKTILEVGPGIGVDGFFFAKNGARHLVFADIVEENLSLLKRLSRLLDVDNVDFYYINNFEEFHFSTQFDALLGIGSLHHMPFEFMQKEIAGISPFIKEGGLALMLAYPYERYLYLNAQDEADFAKKTDGERTPWAEWYDAAKAERLFGPEYQVRWWRNFGEMNREFNWFEIVKSGKQTP